MVFKKKNPQGDQKENKSEQALQIIIGLSGILCK
jgi:hypothetical protein